LISAGIVGIEADELGPLPFVDTVSEDPAGTEVGALVVHDSLAECDGSVGGEPLGDPTRLVVEAELPALDEEVLLEILPLVPAKLESASTDDCRDELLGVVNVVKGQGHESPH
jgi:hypothetical protein